MPPTAGRKISGDLSKSILNQLLAKEENKICADCSGKGPRWASWNLGVMLCIRCSGIHRSLGVHISRVKSVTLDSWNEEQLISICSRGNGWAKEKYEANLPKHFVRPQKDVDVEHFIRDKYEKKKYISSADVPLRSLKEFEGLGNKNEPFSAKHDINGNLANGKNTLGSAIPRPKSGSNRSFGQQQAAAAPVVNGTFSDDHPPTSSLDDLLGLETPAPQTTQSYQSKNDVTFDLFSSPAQQQTQSQPQSNPFVPVPGQAQQSQNSPTPGPQPMSKDTILSLYSQNVSPVMQQNPYMMPGVYPNQAMLGFSGYQQQAQMMPVAMGYPTMPPAMPSGFPQPVNLQAAQQLQWQQQQQQQQMQQQLQQQMQGLRIQPNNMQMSFSTPQTGQVPSPNRLTHTSYLSPVRGVNVSSQPLGNAWQQPTAPGPNNHTLSADLWK